jgi:amidohydrolase
MRFMEESVQTKIKAEIERTFEIARTLGGDYQLRFETGVLPMVNEAGTAALIQKVAADLLGAEHIRMPELGLGAEDFSCFTKLVPGAMFVLGCQIDGSPRQLHNPFFDLDERSLPIGAAMLAETALRQLRS